MFFNNINYLILGLYDSYILDYIIGNSVITTFLLFICSYIFRFCNWYRYIIITNFINITIANLDAIFYININNIQMFVLLNIINVLGISYSLYNKLNNKNEKCIK